MLISLTVGKVDAGVAVLLTEDKRLIEFPSILLPPSITSGSIVDITVSRNFAAEAAAQKSFSALQDKILHTYGERSPSPPVLRCRNATQTSVVLEWEPIELATADLRTLTLFRNGNRAGGIPRPLEMTSTKISGLAVDTEYNFQLVLKTSAGTFSSEKLVVRTHKMTDLSGITVTPGILPAALKDSLGAAIERIGAKMVETVRIDTTHFVCTEGRGAQWERAVEMNIPVVRPEWVEGCEREGRIVGVRGYYLNANPKDRQIGQGVGLGSETNLPNRGTVGSPPPASVEAMRSPIRPAVPPKDGQELADSPAHTPTTTGGSPQHHEEEEEEEEQEAHRSVQKIDENARQHAEEEPSDSEDEPDEMDEKKAEEEAEAVAKAADAAAAAAAAASSKKDDNLSMATTLGPGTSLKDGQRTPEGMEDVEL